MTEGGPSEPVATLLAILEQEYAVLLRRLTDYLGSGEMAADALHDAYVKLRSDPSVSDLRQPRSYLYRMAINLALNNRRKSDRLTLTELHELEAFPDRAPDPERIALISRELEHALEALHALPPKRRDIFLARWRDDMSHADIARAFRLHKRSIQKELFRVETYLRGVLGRPR